MRTLEEAATAPGVSETEFGLKCHFSPIPNWYMPMGFECPRCDNPIDWDWAWYGEVPQITTIDTPALGKPVITGAFLIAYGHRWIRMECDKCHTQLFAENFD